MVSETPAQQPSAQPAGQSSDWQVVSHDPQEPTQLSEQQRYQAATSEGSLWRKVLGMNPDSQTLAKHGFTNDTYNQAESKYREVTAGEIARGASFNPATQKIYDPAEHSAVIRGANKGFVQTLSGTSQLAGKTADKLGLRHKNLSDLITDDGQPRGIFGEAPATDAETKPEGLGENVGYWGENLLEFLSGEEALKSLSLAQKLGLATKIAKLSESSPTVAKLINAGLRATRTATVSAGQEAAHGGDTGDVLTAAGTGFLTHAGSEGLGELSKLAKPVIKKIAGESLETMPKWKGAGTAAKLAEANQEPAKRVIANVARDSAEPIVQKFGQKAPETITSFKDAAQAVEAASKPVFQKLDEISGNGFQTAKNELDSANKVIRRATSMEDLKAAEKAAADAQGKIDTIFKNAEGKVSPDDLQNARSAWRSKKVLEQLHSKIDQAFDSPQAASDISGATRTLDLAKLQGRLNAAFQKIPKQDLETVLGKEGTKSLFDLAKLGADPARAKTLGEIAMQIGSHLSSGGAGALAGAAIGHAVPGGSIALGLHFLFSHPEAGALVARLLSKGLTPKLIVPTVLQLLQQQRTE
ncbi:MAG TPA: hypothetical protein VJW20_07330 [Candidatus Angelobacter sp.]|nr:hypothetical protein [Candidatus Angelobacter sp.]